jgi:hypothetical protein
LKEELSGNPLAAELDHIFGKLLRPHQEVRRENACFAKNAVLSIAFYG